MDSGADDNYMSVDCADELDLVPDEQDVIFIKSFDGRRSRSSGTVDAIVELIGEEIHLVDTEFHVVDNAPAPIVLGKSFLNGRAVFNFVKGTAEFYSCQKDEELNNRKEAKEENKPKAKEEKLEIVEKCEKKSATECNGLPSDIYEDFISLFQVKEEQSFIPATTMTIPTTTAKPIREKVRQLNESEMQEVRQQTEDLLKRKVIKPSSSPWSFPTVLVKKKTGGSRMCIDYRRLNAVTIKDNYPLPRIDRILALHKGNKLFSSLDCKDGFYHLKLADNDTMKTAFITPFGLYEYIGSPFGLKNTPSSFQRAMNTVLEPVSSFCQPFVDDILISSQDDQQHRQHIRAVLLCLQNNNLTLNLKKCQWFKSEVDVLGHVISASGINPHPFKINSIANFPLPKTKKDVQSFLGLVNYVARFFPHISPLTKSLRQLTGKNVKFEWSNHHDESFIAIKDKVTFSSTLTFTDNKLRKIIFIESDDNYVGASLFQVNAGKQEMLDSRSRLLSSSEQRYSELEKEALALDLACEKFKLLLIGPEIIVKTSKPGFKSMLSKSKLPTRLSRIILSSQDLDLTIECDKSTKPLSVDFEPKKEDLDFLIPTVFIDGACLKNGSSDATSAYGIWWCDGNSLNESKTIDGHSTNQRAELIAAIRAIEQGIKQGYSHLRIVTDSQYVIKSQTEWITLWSSNGFVNSKGKPVVNSDLHQQLFELSSKLKVIWCHVNGHSGVLGNERADQLAREALCLKVNRICSVSVDDQIRTEQGKEDWLMKIKADIENGKPHKKFTLRNGLIVRHHNEKTKVVVPKKLRKDILGIYHDSAIAGGHFGMSKTSKRIEETFWWKGLREDVIRYISSCHQCQLFKPLPGKPTGHLRPIVPNGYMDMIAVDFVGPLPVSQSGNRFIVVCIEYLSKFATVKAMSTIDAKATALFLVENVFCVHGLPNQILTDQGNQFKSNLIRELLQCLKIKQLQSAPYHPECNGLVERLNGTLTRSLKKYVYENPKSWDEFITLITFSYNNSVQASIGYSFFEVANGRKAKVFEVNSENNEDTTSDVVRNLKARIKQIEEEVQLRDEFAKENQQEVFNKHHTDRRFKQGDMVMLRRQTFDSGSAKKFATKFIGPYEVVSTLNEGRNVEIKIHGKLKIQSTKNIKLYNKREDQPADRSQIETSASISCSSNDYDNVLSFISSYSAMGNLIPTTSIEPVQEPSPANDVLSESDDETEIYEVEELAEEDDPRFVCNQCNHRFSNLSNLRRHVRAHEDALPFACNICDRRFSANYLRNKHQSMVHPLSFICSNCDWQYSSKTSLTRHRRLYHNASL